MDWSRGPTVGRGSSAAVSAAFSKFSGEVFAVKSTEFSSSDSLQQEQSILSVLTHPRIVTYIGHNTTMENHKLLYNLLIEFLPGGTLIDEIRRQNVSLKEPLMGYYTRHILEGLDHIHSIGIAHCDIKGQNILVGEKGAKIADFGCAKWVHSPDKIKTIAGTPMFMSPETARGEEQSFPADIWALGCTIIEIATGKSPWSGISDDPACILYRIAFSDESPTIPDFLSGKAKDFLFKCLSRDPKERWTSKELLKHPFVNQESNFHEERNKEINFCSPTSIIDLNLWNSVEEVSEVPSPCSKSETCSPVGRNRIRQLTSYSGEPNWTDEENWMTVRVG
ncbi:mitogen-activated protein kinase kinase kinase 18-like [Impatiens glandulifera]|uniref:mitogen-activated protein kinase kinase kinase 18-like n=1 Tax=Impatiens glandulifera TaxID=253017 RepID=UPI001FB0E287|nr:mitogen-activated protein kinase kinase kinase 18-like [Impatiens glandulifera]